MPIEVFGSGQVAVIETGFDLCSSNYSFTVMPNTLNGPGEESEVFTLNLSGALGKIILLYTMHLLLFLFVVSQMPLFTELSNGISIKLIIDCSTWFTKSS